MRRWEKWTSPTPIPELAKKKTLSSYQKFFQKSFLSFEKLLSQKPPLLPSDLNSQGNPKDKRKDKNCINAFSAGEKWNYVCASFLFNHRTFSTIILLSPSSSAQTFTSEKFNPRSIARRNPFVKFCQIGDSSSNLSRRSPRKLGGIVSF